MSWGGIQEGATVLAERVQRRIRRDRLLAEAHRMEANLAETMIVLGERMVALRTARRKELLADAVIGDSLRDVASTKGQIARLDQRLRKSVEETVGKDLLLFQQALEGQEAVFERWEVHPRSPCIGKGPADLRFVDHAFLLAVHHQGKVVSSGSLQPLQPGDDLFVVGTVRALQSNHARMIG